MSYMHTLVNLIYIYIYIYIVGGSGPGKQQRPSKNRPSPTIGIPRSRKYRLGNPTMFGLG